MFNKEKFSEILTKIYNTYNNQRDFADSTGVNRAYLSQYINQKLDNPPSPKVLMKIANNSNGITTYEELMEICGFLISNVHTNLNEIRNAQKTLEYSNMIKKMSLSEKEEEIVNKINTLFDDYNKNNSIEESQKKSLELLGTIDTSNCDINKIKDAAKIYIVSRCAQKVANGIYEQRATIDTKYNYIEAINKLNTLNDDIAIDLKSNNKKYYMCPVYGQISAGQPNWAEECIEGRLMLDPDLMGIVNPEEHFFLRVNGESMNKVIKNGAFALIHKQDMVNDGEIAVVLVNGYDATLKKFTRQGEMIILEPQSTDTSIKTQVYDKTTPIKILGKYVGKMEINK